MMVGKDLFWHDYEKYGYTEADFEDESDVVAEADWKEVKEAGNDTALLAKKEDN